MRPFYLRQRAEWPCIISGRTRSRDFHLAADSRKEREYVKCNQTKDKNGCFVSDGSCSNVHIYGICAAGYGIFLQFFRVEGLTSEDLHRNRELHKAFCGRHLLGGVRT